jgi:hypothetical protein
MPRNRSRLGVIGGVFFWIGSALAAVCVVIVSASNTALIGRFERASVPLSWVVAGLAMVTLLAAECCHAAGAGTTEKVTPSHHVTPKAATPAEAQASAEELPQKV